MSRWFVAKLARRISSAEKNCVGGWDRGDCIELVVYPVSVDIIVFRNGEGLYPIGMTLEARDIVVDAIE